MKLKKLISVILLTSLVLSVIILPITASPDIAYPTFVALGDSIAFGETLENKEEQRYSTLVGNQIGAEVINHAVNGMNSDGLILALNSGAYDESLEKANFVSVSIGSNDLLLPFMQIITDLIKEIDIGIENVTTIVNNQSILYDMFKTIADAVTENTTLLDACDDFKAKLATIVSILKKKAPNAELYFNNIYNPYAKITVKNPLTGEILMDLDELSEYYISRINKNFDSKSYNYTLVDLYTPFNEGGLTNAKVNLLNFTLMSLDPHPNADGHKAIADILLNTIGIMPRPVDIEGHWGEPYILAMIHKGLFAELINDKFNPDSPMSRGMFVIILGRLMNVKPTAFTRSAFSDVSTDDYYWRYVAWASYNKIVLGTGDDKFEPDMPITREEMAVIIERCINAFKYTLDSDTIDLKSFNDESEISSWATVAITFMQKTGLYKGDEKNNVSPRNTITNAEVVTILYRLDDAIKNSN